MSINTVNPSLALGHIALVAPTAVALQTLLRNVLYESWPGSDDAPATIGLSPLGGKFVFATSAGRVCNAEIAEQRVRHALSAMRRGLDHILADALLHVLTVHRPMHAELIAFRAHCWYAGGVRAVGVSDATGARVFHESMDENFAVRRLACRS